MPVCTITGALRNLQGIALASTKVVFERSGVSGQDGAVVIPRSVEAVSDANGEIEVALYPGTYTAITTGIRGEAKFAVGVPDELTADLADIIDQFPLLTPTVLALAQAARDEAVAAAATVSDGASAYEIAVANGFVGTEVEWLASLQGGGAAPSDVSATFTLADGRTVTVTNGIITAITETAPVVTAPSITASDTLVGRTLTITVTSQTGGAATPQLTLLTLDGADVLGDQTGTGPWSYVVPDSAAAQTVAWTVTATNSGGTDTESGSEIVAANVAAPATQAAPTLVGGSESATLTLASAPDDGGSPITQYQYQIDLASGDFADPVATGTQSPANLGQPIEVAPLAVDDYKARSRAVNAAGAGEWSAASAPATVTEVILVTSTAQIEAALIANAPAGGRTIRIAPGAMAWGTTRIGRGLTFTNPMILTGSEGTVLDSMLIGHVNGLTVRGLEIHESTGTKNAIQVFGVADNIIIEDCEIHGVFYPPLADLSAAGTYSNGNGIVTVNSSGLCQGITVRRNKIHDIEEAVVLTMTGANGFSVTDNEIYKTYSDCIKFSLSGAALTAPKVVSRNVCYDFMGDPSDAVNPHIDVIQFVSNSTNNGLEMTNLTIEQNVAWESTGTRGRSVQGIVAFTDASTNVILKDAVVSGNSLHLSGNNSINLRAVSGGTFNNNSITNASPTYPETGAGVMRIGEASSTGAIIAQNNVADAYALVGTVDTTGNVTLGVKGAAIPYATQFGGTDFDIQDFTEAKSQWSVASGTAGAIGSGYGTYGDVRDSSGWNVA